ncbi:MAG TPA: site-2 protease family protein [Methanoregulaceae archaeon]|nr:site-2 protease family protein [Methanoregulaceae archaeon]
MLERMDWVTDAAGALSTPLGRLVLLLVAIYVVLVVYLKRSGRYADHVLFYGPILALKTTRVGFFDIFRRISSPLRLYASLGVVAVALVSFFVAFSLLFSFQLLLVTRPEPTQIIAPQNILLIPGVNEFVPGTLAVWLALVITLVVHEFGHGILSRVEGIRVKAAGVLLAVIPIGAFVEPDEEELFKAPRGARMRMYGAGITNNFVVGLLSILLMIALVGMATPVTTPIIHGVYKDSPAYNASVPSNAVVVALNGTPVHARDEIGRLLSPSRPGDIAELTVEASGQRSTHRLVLAPWPGNVSASGFMGIEYYDGAALQAYVRQSFNPFGILQYLFMPFNPSPDARALRILGFPGASASAYLDAPFVGFWTLVHLCFWSGWINLNVGIFNALPMLPFDGGYIFKEAVGSLLARIRLERLSPYIVGGLSWLMAVTMISLIALPYLFQFF